MRGGHNLVGTGTVYECRSDAFILKIAQLDRGVLWRIKIEWATSLSVTGSSAPSASFACPHPVRSGKQK